MERNILDFIEHHVAAVCEAEREANEAWWTACTTGDPELERAHREKARALRELHANREHYARVRTYDEDNIGSSPKTRRQLRLMRLQFARNQLPEDVLERMREVESAVQREFHTYRAVASGDRYSANDVRDVLATSDDSALRRSVWEGWMTLGDVIGPELVRLVGIRNRAARDLDYRDYYHMALDLREIDEAQLIHTLDELVERTDAPYREAKKELDASLVERFGQPRIMPWHYTDVFLRKAAEQHEARFDRYYQDRDLIALATDFFDGIGLDVRDILARSDLEEKPDKLRKALCLHVDRRSDDVRILGTLHQDAGSMSELLGQLGRALYMKHMGPGLPYLLREARHTLCSEAVAVLLGRLARSPDFLTKVAGANKSAVTRLTRSLHDERRLGLLINARWAAATVHFEKALYENPGRDLTRVWWELVEELQHVPMPDGRLEHHDWASEVRFSTTPIHHLESILGELAAAQLWSTIRRETGCTEVVGNVPVGDFLRERLFESGALHPWHETIERVTGEPLTCRHLLEPDE